MRVTIQDLTGQIANLLSERTGQASIEGPSFQERQTAAELPLFISTGSGIEAILDLNAVDQWDTLIAPWKGPV